MAAPPPPAAPGTFPYDYLFKVLIIGDASVGKVSFVFSNQSINQSIKYVLFGMECAQKAQVGCIGIHPGEG